MPSTFFAHAARNAALAVKKCRYHTRCIQDAHGIAAREAAPIIYLLDMTHERDIVATPSSFSAQETGRFSYSQCFEPRRRFSVTSAILSR